MPKFSDAMVRAALEGRRAVREYPMPGANDVRVGIRVLSDLEMDDARGQAQHSLKDHKIDVTIDPMFFDRLIQREVISRAFVDVDNHSEPFFSSEREVSEMDASMVAACWELYQRHQVAADPFASCSAEEVDELVELLGKSDESAETWRLFDSPTLWSFVRSMALRLREMSASHRSNTG